MINIVYLLNSKSSATGNMLKLNNVNNIHVYLEEDRHIHDSELGFSNVITLSNFSFSFVVLR